MSKRVERLLRAGPVMQDRMTHAELLEIVRDAAKVGGWKLAFTWKSLHSPAGFPDCVLVHPGRRRIVYAELKTMKGKVTPSQQDWMDTLRQAGAEVYLWRPDSVDDVIALLVG